MSVPRPCASSFAILALAVPAVAQCDPHWAGGFNQFAADREVRGLATFQGDLVFGMAESPASTWRAHLWDGEVQSTILTVQNPAVSQAYLHGFLEFSQGGEPRLAAHGLFDRVAGGPMAFNVVVWDGTSWSALGGGLGTSSGGVVAMCVYDDGTGPSVYAGGSFAVPGGGSGIARLNGSSWVPVGGASVALDALQVWDDGSGPALYVAGTFATIGGVTARNIARWNGSAWSALGDGTMIGSTLTLATHDDGTGSALYAGGLFSSIGGVAATRVARWDGTSWSALGTGVNSTVLDLASFDDGSGPALYAFGVFTQAGGSSALRAARWNGTAWSALGSGLGSEGRSAVVFDDGSGPGLCVGGTFATAGGLPTGRLARWRAGAWGGVAENDGFNAPTSAVLVHDDGSGPRVYAGGAFTRSGPVTVNAIARWGGSAWEALGTGMSGASAGNLGTTVEALATFDDGAGPKLYAGGSFTGAGGVAATGIARWTGTSWQALAGGSLLLSGSGDYLKALCVHDDGTGPALYAGGCFTRIGGVVTARVARWNGTTWSALGTGTQGAQPLAVLALASGDDGGGPALYVGGNFSGAGGVAETQSLARWRGGAWSSLGALDSSSTVHALRFLTAGILPRLWVGGVFASIGGVDARGVATWDGAGFAPVGAGFPSGASSYTVRALAEHDGGAGRDKEAYATGNLGLVGGIDYHGVARWDGAAWQPVDGGIGTGEGRALASHDAGTGASLWLAGSFAIAGEHGSWNVARLDPTCLDPRGFCFGDGSAIPCPCGNASTPGDDAGCLNSLGLGGTLRASGLPSLANDTVVLAGAGMPNSSALYFHGGNVANGGAGILFGDGIKCTASPFVRLGTKFNVGGASSYPVAGDLSVSVRGNITSPGTRHYQVHYRNAADFCTSAPFNYTNAVTIVWAL